MASLSHTIFSWLAISCIIKYGVHSLDTTAGCSKQPPQAVVPPFRKPTMPNTFEVHVECSILNKNQSTELHEFYDYDGNRGRIIQRQNGKTLWAYYDYNAKELIELYKDTNVCTVTDLSDSPERLLFGYSATNGHIFTASGSLRFSQTGIKEIYVGTADIRGIKTRVWYSCQFWEKMSASMDVWWYFSDPNSWDTAIGLPEIPVRAHVQGIVYATDIDTYQFEHIYDFVHFKNYIKESTVFETPSMIACPNRKNTKPFPGLANSFSFSIEEIDNVRQAITFRKESYDRKNNATKFEYKPSALIGSPYGYRPLTEIHDFNTGVAYIIDKMYGNCSKKPIEKKSFDDKSIDSLHLRMNTALEFFLKDNTVVSYEGIKTVRNIPCDTWIGNRTTTPSGDTYTSTLEWYFKTDDWTSVEHTDQVSITGGIPVQMKLNIPDLGTQTTYNIYSFSQETQDLLSYDISQCYENSNKRKIEFQVPGQYRNNINDNRNIFKYSTLVSLAGSLDVSPLRFANIQLEYETDNFYIRFDMLEKAPLIGDIAQLKEEVSLNVAVSLLTDLINSNQMIILLISESTDKVIPVHALKGSLISYAYGTKILPPNKSKSGYSPGAMTGVAFGMIVTGGVAGVLTVFKFLK